MKKNKIWSIISTIIVIVIVAIAVLLVGVRVFGLKVYTVLSGSMEPTYHVGSVIYVKGTDPEDVEVGDPITFVLNESLTVATHRVVEITRGDDGSYRFITKGDANETVDGGYVHEKNLIGKPVFSIPYLGYLANYIQKPPGMYVAIMIVAVCVILFFIPGGDNKKEKKEKKPEDEGEGPQ